MGFSAISTNNGLSEGSYKAWSAGLTAPIFEMDTSLTFSKADDDTFNLNSDTWILATAKPLRENLALAVGIEWKSLEYDSFSNKGAGVVVEITQAF